MEAVNICICHDNDFMVTYLFKIKLFSPNTCSHCSDHGFYFFMGKHLIKTGLFHIQYFTFERQNSLVFAVTPLLCRASCRITLNQKQFTQCRIRFLTVSQFSWKSTELKYIFSAGNFSCFFGSKPGSLCINGFGNNLFCNSRILLQMCSQIF